MVDTGSEVNIIKAHLLPNEIDIDKHNHFYEYENSNLQQIPEFKSPFKIYFKKMLQNISAELDLKNYSTEEINATFEIFQEVGSGVETINTLSIQTQDISIEDSNLLNQLRLDHLTEEEREHVINLALSNRDRFHLEGQKLGAASTVMHRIPTIDDIPVNIRQYKVPISLKEEVEGQVNELLKDGIIKPSTSPYNSPLWIVPKKMDASGKQKWRLVSDFRLLNEKTITDGYPLPDITQIIDQVGGHKYYTTLDLAKGFQQILMDPRDSHKTAFSTPHGHYEYVRMTFGLKNAPPTFQRFIDETFKNLQGKILFTFIDDIVVFSDTLAEHENKMNLIMERLRESNLQLNLDKCEFLRKEVCYLGHILSKKGISPDPRKLEAVKNFPRPKNIKNIRQFLGLSGYYRRFIKNFSQIAKPLSKLLQKEVEFCWTEKEEKAFSTLKEFLCNPPVLQYPDFSKPFNITTDASGYAIGGILSQGESGKDHPIAYTSRVLRGPELSYEVYEKEALAMVHAVQTFRSYIYGKRVKIFTDHKPLVWFKTAELNTRVQKWRFKLSEFDYEVIYKEGKQNSNADALSRNPTEPTQFCNVVTRRQQKLMDKDISKPQIINQSINSNENKMNVNSSLQETPIKSQQKPQRLSKRIAEKEKQEYAESESSFSTEPKAKTALPPDKNSLESISSKTEDDMEDTVKMTESNFEEEILNQQKTNSSFNGSSSCNSTSSNQRTWDHDPNLKCQFIETKEMIQVRNDNIIYFTSNTGKPCDKGGRKLIEFNKIEPNQNFIVPSVNHIKKGTKTNYFSLCIKGDEIEPISSIQKNIYTVLKELRELVNKLNLKTLNIAKNETIEGIAWSDVVNLLKIVFKDTEIKIIICKGSLKYVPAEKRNEIFDELHSSPIGGHRGVSKTYNRIKTTYYWENLKDDIQRRIQQCLNCQLKKLVRLKTKQPMVITDTPGTVFDKVALDVVGPLPKTKNGCEYILTMQDQLSKFCVAVPLKDTLATTIADVFVKRFICVFGAPRVVITDQGQNFLSKLMQRVSKRFKIKKIRTTAFHPQSNGSLERSHHALGEFLKQYTTVDEEWDQWLEIAIINYNTCVSESTKHTPYEVVFGRIARLPSSDPLREADLLPTYKDYVTNLVARLNGIRSMVYENLVSSKFKSKKYYDRRINSQNFKVGDYVFLLKGPKPNKFGNHYSGPHKILEVINSINVRISMQKTSKVVHSNRLRISYINREIKEKKRKRKNDDDE